MITRWRLVVSLWLSVLVLCAAQTSSPITDVSLDISTGTGDTPTAGDVYTLSCTATGPPGLALEPTWLDHLNNTITNSDDFTISELSSISPTALTVTRILNFTKLRTSQGGVYTCVVTLEDSVVSDSAQVSVKIPATTSVTFEPSHEGPLYEGTSVNLECSVAVDRDVVDTEVLTAFTFTRTPDVVLSSSNVTGTGVTFTGVVTFPLLVSSRDKGQISCESRFLPVGGSTYVQAGDSTTQPYQLEIEPLPAPTVAMTSAPLTIAGDTLSLTCTATVVDNLVVTPDLQWLGPDGSNLVAMDIEQTGLVFIRKVELNSLRTSQGGQYRCEATLTIPDGPTALGMASTDVRVQIAPMLNTVLVGETVAGTVMSLVGSVSLGPVVDTGVSLSAQWTSQGQTLTVSTTNTTTLTFEPLSQTDSSDYVYMVTVEPDNSTYVESNSASQSINLTVQPYPDLVAKICVLCGECMTQGMTTLTGDVSLHPNTSPNYSLAYLWRDPSGDLITESSHSDLVVEEERLIVRDVERNEGDYSLTACLTVPGSDVVDHCSQETVQSISAIKPGPVSDLTCSSTDGSDLFLNWTEPALNAGSVIKYLVEVLQYVQPEGTRVLQLVDLSLPYTHHVMGLEAAVLEGVGPAIPYMVKVMPRNPAGCGVPTVIDCFTEEGIPSVIPDNIIVSRPADNLTTIVVSWQPLTLVEARGFIEYLVVLRAPDSGETRLTSTDQSVTFTDLDPSQSYQVSVATVTSSGVIGQRSRTKMLAPVPSTGSDNTIMFIVAAGVGAMVILAIVAIVVVALLLIRRNRRATLNLKDMLAHGGTVHAQLRDLRLSHSEDPDTQRSPSPVYAQLAETDTTDPRDRPTPPPRTVPPDGDEYQLTTCPAYVPSTFCSEGASKGEGDYASVDEIISATSKKSMNDYATIGPGDDERPAVSTPISKLRASLKRRSEGDYVIMHL